MTDTSPQAEAVSEDDDDVELEEPYLYVEISTRLLYEVRFFENFVLIRLATPAYYLAIAKISHEEFSARFEEYEGDQEAARAAIRGDETPELLVTWNDQ